MARQGFRQPVVTREGPVQLTADQTRAVRSWQRGDICVVAGPGSGKTRVLVERIRWLILDRDVVPERILAITFTEKAALEMRSRLVGDATASREDRIKFQAAQISTIDAFCNRLLRENVLEAGVDPGFELLDETASRDLLHGVIEQALDAEFARGGAPLRAFLAAYAPGSSGQVRGDAFGLRDDLAALVRRIRSYGCDPFLAEPSNPGAELAAALEALAAAKGSAELAGLARRFGAASEPAERAALIAEIELETKPIRKAGKLKGMVSEIKDVLLPACRAAAVSESNQVPRKWLLQAVRRTLRGFDAAKRAAGRMDFDDVLAKAGDLLGSGTRPAPRFEHVLIDEFQDTNPLQVRLVERLLGAHGENRPVRFVVGDINQSIYGFRHADQNVFRAFREGVEKRGGEVIRLTENFRSRPEILSMVRVLLPGGRDSGVERHSLQGIYRFPPKDRPSCEVQVVSAGGDAAPEWEAAWIASRLHALRRELRLADRRAEPGRTRPLQWGDVAILVRTHLRAALLASALRRHGVPCDPGAGRNLFQSPEVVELAAFLRVLRNPRDEISLAAVFKSPFCGVDDAVLLRLKMQYSNLADCVSGPVPAGGIDAASVARLENISKLVHRCRADRATVSVRSLLARAVSACGYRSYLAHGTDGSQALANLDRLLDWIGRREEQGEAGLDAVSAALDRALEARPVQSESPDRGAGDGESVAILTMHAAKGLEFPVAVLASLQSGSRGTVPGLLFSDSSGLGARWREPFGPEPAPDAAYRAIAADIQERERQESDRLFYVAQTRAEEHLVLSAGFPAAPQKKNWAKLVFDRLGIGPRDAPSGEAEERSTGDARFVYRSVSSSPPGRLEGDGIQVAGPALVRPLQPSAQPDYLAAVTSVAMFAQCPRRYFLSRYLGLDETATAPRPDDPAADEPASLRDGTVASEFGELVHRHLAGELAEATPAVRRLADRFRAHELGKRVERATRVDREMSLVFAVDGFLLRGTIDLLFEEGGDRVLVDYKTDRVPVTGLQRSARRYAPQIQLYAAGLARSSRPASRAVLFYLRPGEAIDIDIGERALERARELVGAFFDAQASQSYPLRTGRHCLRCPHYRGDCPAELS